MSIYFNHPSQGNSTNYYLILGLRDKAAPPTSQQINKFPPKRVKNLATPSSTFIFIFSSSTRELCSQPIRGNDRPIGRMFPEHAERSFLDPEYSFDEYFQLGSRTNIRPIKNGLKRRQLAACTTLPDVSLLHAQHYQTSARCMHHTTRRQLAACTFQRRSRSCAKSVHLLGAKMTAPSSNVVKVCWRGPETI